MFEKETYTFKEANKNSFIFLPGYSGGLEVPIIKVLTEHFIAQKDLDVLGVALPYHDDTADNYDKSQQVLKEYISEYSQKYPHKKIHLIAKSLGGSLSLFNADTLRIHRIVILGCSVVLGWPQQISLLSSDDPKLPEYKKEWEDTLRSVSVPVTIVSGEKDDLTDNTFLKEIEKENEFLQVVVLPNADHGLKNIDTGELYTKECVEIIEEKY